MSVVPNSLLESLYLNKTDLKLLRFDYLSRYIWSPFTCMWQDQWRMLAILKKTLALSRQKLFSSMVNLLIQLLCQALYSLNAPISVQCSFFLWNQTRTWSVVGNTSDATGNHPLGSFLRENGRHFQFANKWLVISILWVDKTIRKVQMWAAICWGGALREETQNDSEGD